MKDCENCKFYKIICDQFDFILQFGAVIEDCPKYKYFSKLFVDNGWKVDEIYFKVEGLKSDHGKLQLDLVPVNSINEIAKIFEHGLKKYGKNNWKKGIKHSRLYSAALRHIFSWWNGNDNDDESGLPHLYHAIVNLIMIMETPDFDDRDSK